MESSSADQEKKNQLVISLLSAGLNVIQESRREKKKKHTTGRLIKAIMWTQFY